MDVSPSDQRDDIPNPPTNGSCTDLNTLLFQASSAIVAMNSPQRTLNLSMFAPTEPEVLVNPAQPPRQDETESTRTHSHELHHLKAPQDLNAFKTEHEMDVEDGKNQIGPGTSANPITLSDSDDEVEGTNPMPQPTQEVDMDRLLQAFMPSSGSNNDVKHRRGDGNILFGAVNKESIPGLKSYSEEKRVSVRQRSVIGFPPTRQLYKAPPLETPPASGSSAQMQSMPWPTENSVPGPSNQGTKRSHEDADAAVVPEEDETAINFAPTLLSEIERVNNLFSDSCIDYIDGDGYSFYIAGLRKLPVRLVFSSSYPLTPPTAHSVSSSPTDQNRALQVSTVIRNIHDSTPILERLSRRLLPVFAPEIGKTVPWKFGAALAPSEPEDGPVSIDRSPDPAETDAHMARLRSGRLDYPPPLPEFASKENFNNAFISETLARTIFFDYGREVEGNERLEFLGDQVLNGIIASTLMRKYQLNETGMTRLSAILRCNTLFSTFSRAYNFPDRARSLSPRSSSTTSFTFRPPPSAPQYPSSWSNRKIEADIFEAVVGGLYLDGALTEPNGYMKLVEWGDALFEPWVDWLRERVKRYQKGLWERWVSYNKIQIGGRSSWSSGGGGGRGRVNSNSGGGGAGSGTAQDITRRRLRRNSVRAPAHLITARDEERNQNALSLHSRPPPTHPGDNPNDDEYGIKRLERSLLYGTSNIIQQPQAQSRITSSLAGFDEKPITGNCSTGSGAILPHLSHLDALNSISPITVTATRTTASPSTTDQESSSAICGSGGGMVEKGKQRQRPKNISRTGNLKLMTDPGHGAMKKRQKKNPNKNNNQRKKPLGMGASRKRRGEAGN